MKRDGSDGKMIASRCRAIVQGTRSVSHSYQSVQQSRLASCIKLLSNVFSCALFPNLPPPPVPAASWLSSSGSDSSSSRSKARLDIPDFQPGGAEMGFVVEDMVRMMSLLNTPSPSWDGSYTLR